MSALNNQPLPKPLRTQLENTVKAARDVAEVAATAALAQLAVGEGKAPDYLTDPQKALRRRLRAHGRALGDVKASDDSQTIRHLVWETAYEHWHRMLFARFLAENGLLLWEPGAPVTLAECEEMAQDPATNLGAKSGWDLAGKLAARMLPQVFKPQHPVFDMAFALEHQRKLETLLAALPEEVFKASDSLGWVYQFWQAKRKDEVNASEVKIGADELSAVTQLFTEPYMVDFLLHNSLGAWWTTRHPGKTCPVRLTYLRTLDDGTPAAGKFEGWPDTLEQFKLLDPCCGSGHFLVAAFLLLVPMRMAAEGLTAMDAVDLVLQDNLHGLELDARCVEIAVFALALAAWRFTDENGDSLGVRSDMPAPNIACCGLKVAASANDWESLVPDDSPNASLLRQELRLLHSSFAQAPLLGSLLDPARSLKNDLATSSFETVHELLEQALSSELSNNLRVGCGDVNDDAWDSALTAKGLLASAKLLDNRYHLVITNVPYLGRGKHSEDLKSFCELNYQDSKSDLANVFLDRCIELSIDSGQGAVQVVMPQNWLFLASYKKQRQRLLRQVRWDVFVDLGGGAEAFESGPGNITNICLLSIRNYSNQQSIIKKSENFAICGLDVSVVKSVSDKSSSLINFEIKKVFQNSQLENPDSRVMLSMEKTTGIRLDNFVEATQGISPGDTAMMRASFWELPVILGKQWIFLQSTPENGKIYSGCSNILRNPDSFTAYPLSGFRMCGERGWGKPGIAVGKMAYLPINFYVGKAFDANCPVLIIKKPEHALAIAAYCFDEAYGIALR